MTPQELSPYLSRLVDQRLRLSLMLWGPPGIGKSSIVADVAKQHELRLVDLRLSQLAPTDLRGLPVAENGVSRWFPPEFLPTDGQGILFSRRNQHGAPCHAGHCAATHPGPAGWQLPRT
jgi:midasin (ATPase involved in ribosome maturation)